MCVCVCVQGMIVMWDVDGGLPQIDRYLYTNDSNIVAGALLAVGLVNSGVRNECDPVSGRRARGCKDGRVDAQASHPFLGVLVLNRFASARPRAKAPRWMPVL